jgi:hypothetical protein
LRKLQLHCALLLQSRGGQGVVLRGWFDEWGA